MELIGPVDFTAENVRSISEAINAHRMWRASEFPTGKIVKSIEFGVFKSPQENFPAVEDVAGNIEDYLRRRRLNNVNHSSSLKQSMTVENPRDTTVDVFSQRVLDIDGVWNGGVLHLDRAMMNCFPASVVGVDPSTYFWNALPIVLTSSMTVFKTTLHYDLCKLPKTVVAYGKGIKIWVFLVKDNKRAMALYATWPLEKWVQIMTMGDPRFLVIVQEPGTFIKQCHYAHAVFTFQHAADPGWLHTFARVHLPPMQQLANSIRDVSDFHDGETRLRTAEYIAGQCGQLKVFNEFCEERVASRKKAAASRTGKSCAKKAHALVMSEKSAAVRKIKSESS